MAIGSKIFISCRRDDAAAEAGRLSDDLQRALGPGTVFLDVDGIQIGRDFRKVIHQNVGKSPLAPAPSVAPRPSPPSEPLATDPDSILQQTEIACASNEAEWDVTSLALNTGKTFLRTDPKHENTSPRPAIWTNPTVAASSA